MIRLDAGSKIENRTLIPIKLEKVSIQKGGRVRKKSMKSSIEDVRKNSPYFFCVLGVK